MVEVPLVVVKLVPLRRPLVVALVAVTFASCERPVTENAVVVAFVTVRLREFNHPVLVALVAVTLASCERPVTARAVVVAFVVVALRALKSWKVEEAVTARLVKKPVVAESAVVDAYGRIDAVVDVALKKEAVLLP